MSGHGWERARQWGTRMAKASGSGPPRKRKPKVVSGWKTAEQVGDIALDLENLAEQIRALAVNMDRLGIERIKPLMGNYLNATQEIREFIAKQLIARLLPLAAKRGEDIHQLFEGFRGSKNS